MLIATEDHRFWRHPGVDPLALARALWQLATRGHIVSGGSTLTMQVARLLTPHRHDFPGKLQDIVRALQLEARFSKREILAMYLTLAPFGGNIEGVRSAPRSSISDTSQSLPDEQAALLVALPRSPTRLRPDRHFDRAEAAARRVMLGKGLAFRSLDIAYAGRTSSTLNPCAAFCRSGLQRRTLLAGASRRSTALSKIGRRSWCAERAILARETQAAVAVLVISNSDRAVLAYVGGIDYFGPERHGRHGARRALAGLDAEAVHLRAGLRRRAGHARHADRRRCRSASAITRPRISTATFHGTVSAREALQQSYNLPAVEVLNGVGPCTIRCGVGPKWRAHRSATRHEGSRPSDRPRRFLRSASRILRSFTYRSPMTERSDPCGCAPTIRSSAEAL